MIFAETTTVSDAVQITNLIVTGIVACFTAWVGWQTLIVKSRQKENAEIHAVSAREVQDSLVQVKQDIKESAKEVIANVSPTPDSQKPPPA